MNNFRTKFHRLQNDLRRLKEELHIYQQFAKIRSERILELEAENADLRNQLRDALERC